MQTDTIKGAAAWLKSWGGKPRAGILAAAIDGLKMGIAIDRTYGRDTSEIEAALAMLEAARS